ncbi:hypothetical protein F1188_20490 [Roseospira marina]|uniref:DUF4376 domain-containing protein n=1 Tax=Roseospira marina TaxID=140057 RepID=A0A5M6I323_9PROT|nr:hypothetical protein [Roseospira marina]KAA5602611.1 hypothetical protein F1188_20490 [Roseospira marina]MBB4316218.1 hypothetical protein [Roseospira marina]MBB5089476.1 hypothetical protein [Roseospira marina]
MTTYARILNGIAVDVVTADPATLFHPLIAAEFVTVPDDVVPGALLDGDEWTPPPPPPDPEPEPEPATPLEQARAAVLTTIEARKAEILAAGYPVRQARASLHVAVHDAGRADLGGMAITALAAHAGSVAWPAAYAQGWISTENIRIPLPDPGDGLALAAGVGGWYAAVVQHARDLKDAALAAEDTAALDALDPDAGWPTATTAEQET